MQGKITTTIRRGAWGLQMKESKKAFEIRKNIAIAELMAKAIPIMKQLSDDPEFIQDRLNHIERGELWLTPAMLKYSPLTMQLEQIRAQIANIRAATLRPFKGQAVVPLNRRVHK